MEDWLLKLLPEHGCRETIIVQPGERSSHKTDRRDASSLSEVLWIILDSNSKNLIDFHNRNDPPKANGFEKLNRSKQRKRKCGTSASIFSC